MAQFQIEQTLSESTTTSVYRAFQVALARRVLLKVLRPHLAHDPVIRERFVREAHACARLRSEHIVQVFDLTEYEHCPAIVMEYVPGQSLKEVLQGAPADRPDLARKTAVHILKALSVAHRHGITHRDIKPGNILVAEDGTLKLTDFGLAHIADSMQVTTEGIAVGTPAYMSPEQIRGDRIDARTDLFALGATILEVLTGERIFDGTSYNECIRKILAFSPSALDQFAGSAPSQLLAFLKKLMAPDPALRYQSAPEALEQIAEPEDMQGTSAAPGGARSAMWIVGAALIVLAAILSILLWPKPADRKNETVAQQGSLLTVPTPPVVDSAAGSRGKSVQTQHEKAPDAAGSIVDHQQKNEERHDSPENAPGFSFLRLTATPWAKIFVDGRAIGETPMGQTLKIAAGKHSVTFTN
ncbi:MAG TPA: serine/threonine-protein kinase, partial [Bacteroidota bacterium]|nr:serine/threonine-protein kinase [Bacteroidota bacterium]